MTQRIADRTGVDRVWELLDGQVAAGRMPGYVAALRVGGETAVRAHGRTALGDRAAPMRDDTQFRIASLTKPMGGALTLTLVRDGVLALDDPIARWLPEAAEPRVLVSADAPLDRTVPAERPVTVRDLLVGTSGWGVVMEPTPLQAAMLDRGLFPSALHHDLSADAFVARLADLPLAFQPGSGWLYGLVSTAPDVLRFFTAMADGGAPVLTADEVARMTADALTDPQRRSAQAFLGEGGSWGLGTGVDIGAVHPWQAVGRWGWTGGSGTTASVDPVRDVVAVLLTQRGMSGPQDGFEAFWTAVAQA